MVLRLDSTVFGLIAPEILCSVLLHVSLAFTVYLGRPFIKSTQWPNGAYNVVNIATIFICISLCLQGVGHLKILRKNKPCFWNANDGIPTDSPITTFSYRVQLLLCIYRVCCDAFCITSQIGFRVWLIKSKCPAAVLSGTVMISLRIAGISSERQLFFYISMPSILPNKLTHTWNI